jgi:hypothetical protein
MRERTAALADKACRDDYHRLMRESAKGCAGGRSPFRVAPSIGTDHNNL